MNKKGKKQSPLFLNQELKRVVPFYTEKSLPLNRLSFRIALKKESLKCGSKKAGSKVQHEYKKYKERENKILKKKAKQAQHKRRTTKRLNLQGITAPNYAK